MKKKSVLNLIKYHSEQNDEAFRDEAYQIAKDFDRIGDSQLSEYIVALLSDANTFVPQIESEDLTFFKKVNIGSKSLPLPKLIKDDVIGVINAIGHNVGVNKFLFEGAPGTGKTETVKQIATILERDLFEVEFDSLIDSKLGQTSKNISSVFSQINNLNNPEKVIILFDEIDAISLDRINSNDLREMGRATSAILKGFDSLNEKVVLIATTNLYNKFDKALIRRFDSVVNFNRYASDELIEIAESILDELLNKFKFAGRNLRLFKKILMLLDEIPYPGELKNLIQTALAFSESSNEYDYLRRLFEMINSNKIKSEPKELQENGFTLREIEVLTGISKSQVARELRD